MLGRDHASSAALAFTLIAVPVHLPVAELAVATVLTAGAGLLPDLDEPGSTIARSAGWLTGALAWVVHKVARGHRKGTHSLLGAAVFTAIAWAGAAHAGSWAGKVTLGLVLAVVLSCALRSLPFTGHLADTAGAGLAAGLVFWHTGLALIPVCVAIGVLGHLAGDMATHGGCPLLWPFSGHDFHDTPFQFTTGKFFESRIVSPLLIAGLAAALAWDSGLIHYLVNAHHAGHLAR